MRYIGRILLSGSIALAGNCAQAFEASQYSTAQSLFFVLVMGRDSVTSLLTTNGAVSMPDFTPAQGSFNATQNVAIASTTPGAIYCYALGGTTPVCNAAKTGCSSGVLYSMPVSINATSDLRAVACLSGHADSLVNPATYVIDSVAPSAPTGPAGTPISTSQIDLSWSPATDNVSQQSTLIYQICQSVTASVCNTFSTTYTTTAGASVYSASGLAGLTTYYFRIRALDELGNTSAPTSEISATTQAAGTTNSPAFSPSPGSFASNQNVTITSGTAAATICYTDDNVSTPLCDAGKTGCDVGTLYTGPIAIAATTTLRAVACKPALVDSSVNAGTYTIDSTTPTTPGSPSGSSPLFSGVINLTWTAASDNLTSAPNLVYEICRSTTSGGCGTFTVNYTTAAGATSYSIGSVGVATTYYFRIRARDQVGNTGTPSAQFSVIVVL